MARKFAVHGTVENIPTGSSLVAELSPMSGGRTIQTSIEGNGDFLFDEVPTGDYWLRISSTMAGPVHQEFVSVTDGSSSIVVRLPENKVDRPGSGTVSVRQLQRKIPGKASKELKKADNDLRNGNFEQSIEHLHAAIQLYPDYMEAHNNLGVCYLRTNRIPEALKALQKARELDPDAGLVNANLSSAFLLSGRNSEAEETARRAIKADPTSDKARFILALSLKAQNRSQDEALDNLHRVVAQFPRARLAAAEIFANKGDRNRAVQELQQFLRGDSVSSSDRQVAQDWLSRLQK